MPTRIEVKNHLRNRICSTCSRINHQQNMRSGFGRGRDVVRWCQLYQKHPPMDTCSQWKMGPVEKLQKFDKHKEKVKAKRAAKRQAAKIETHADTEVQTQAVES